MFEEDEVKIIFSDTFCLTLAIVLHRGSKTNCFNTFNNRRNRNEPFGRIENYLE